MPFRSRSRRSRRGGFGRGGRLRDPVQSAGGRGMFGRGRHNHHRREANPIRMLVYLTVIILNLWYRRNKRLNKAKDLLKDVPDPVDLSIMAEKTNGVKFIEEDSSEDTSEL